MNDSKIDIGHGSTAARGPWMGSWHKSDAKITPTPRPYSLTARPTSRCTVAEQKRFPLVIIQDRKMHLHVTPDKHDISTAPNANHSRRQSVCTSLWARVSCCRTKSCISGGQEVCHYGVAGQNGESGCSCLELDCSKVVYRLTRRNPSNNPQFLCSY